MSKVAQKGKMDTLVTPEVIAQRLRDQGIEESADAVPKEKAQEDAKAPEEEVLEAAEEVIEDEVIEVEPQENMTDVERAAMEKGWKPDGPKSAEEFLRAEPLYEEIKQRGKEIKELKTTIDELKAFMAEQKELGYKQAIAELSTERAAAIRRGDVEKVNELDEKISNVSQPKVTEESPEVQQFLERNSKWVNDRSYKGQEIKLFAQQRDQELASFNLTPAEHLAQIESDIREKFSDYFHDTSEATISPTAAVESDSSPVAAKRGKKITFKDLSPEQKACARQFEKRGVMKVDDYITHLKEMGEI